MNILQIFGLLVSSMILSKIAYFPFISAMSDANTPLLECMRVILSSLRFDSSVASLETLLVILLGGLGDAVCSRLRPLYSMRRHVLVFLLTWNALFNIMDLNYFAYYQHRFHVFFWEFFENWENARLVLHSLRDVLAVKPTLFLLLGNALLLALAFKISKKWTSSWPPTQTWRYGLRYASFLALLACGVRSTTGLPLAREASQGLVSKDAFLNQLHSNSYYALYDAYKERQTWILGSRLPQTIDTKALQADWDRNRRSFGLPDLQVGEQGAFVQRLVHPHPGLRKKPKKIILITVESLNEWPLEDQELAADLDGGLRKIRENAYSWTHYVCAGNGTYSNNLKVVLGLPTPIGFPPETSIPEGLTGGHPTMPKVLQAMGLKTTYIYGGSLAWHQIGYVMKRLGFSQVLGESAAPASEKTRFGLHDDDIYQLALDVLDQGGPQFVEVMTLSNHPPYEIPEAEKLRSPIRYGPRTKSRMVDEAQFQKRYRAYRYSTEALSRFISAARDRPWFSDALFIITADHGVDDSSMNGLQERRVSDLIRQRRIPLILFGPDILPKAHQELSGFASHLDLFPTIVGFLVDKPTMVPTFGKSLLDRTSTHRFLYGFDFTCSQTVCLNQGMAYRFTPGQEILEECQQEACKEEAKTIQKFRDLYDQGGLYILSKPSRKQGTVMGH